MQDEDDSMFIPIESQIMSDSQQKELEIITEYFSSRSLHKRPFSLLDTNVTLPLPLEAPPKKFKEESASSLNTTPKWRSKLGMKYDKCTNIIDEKAATTGDKRKQTFKKMPMELKKTSLQFTSDNELQSIAMKYGQGTSNTAKLFEGQHFQIKKEEELKPAPFHVEPTANVNLDENMIIDENLSGEESIVDEEEEYQYNPFNGTYQRGPNYLVTGNFDWRTANLMDFNDVRSRHKGKKGRATFNRQKQRARKKMMEVVEDCKDLPKDDVVASQPYQFKESVKMKQHQLHALKFMTWRETRKNSGGIICDEMGRRRIVI